MMMSHKIWKFYNKGEFTLDFANLEVNRLNSEIQRIEAKLMVFHIQGSEKDDGVLELYERLNQLFEQLDSIMEFYGGMMRIYKINIRR